MPNPKTPRISKIKPAPLPKMTPNEIKVCDLITNPDYRYTRKSDIAKEVGISSVSVYKMLEKKRVVDYIDLLLSYYCTGEIPNVWKALIKKANSGNVPAIKLFFEMQKLYVPPAQVAELSMKDANATINIVTNIPRPLEVGENDVED